MPSHYPYRWLVAASLTLSVSGSIIAQERDPFLPPEVPSNAAEQNSPAPRLPERSEVAPMPEQTWLSQPDLQQQYGEQIAATIIKRSRFVGTLDGARRLLHEPSIGCHLEQKGRASLAKTPCMERILASLYVTQDGQVLYPVHDLPPPIFEGVSLNLASKDPVDTSNGTAGSSDATPSVPPVLASVQEGRYAVESCEEAYSTLLAEQQRELPAIC